MKKKILITGATGYIGKYLTDALLAHGEDVYVVTRNIVSAKNVMPVEVQFVDWNNLLTLKDEKFTTFINLAGMNLSEKRWSAKVKEQIYDSRIISTRELVELISIMNNKPEVLINASGADYYGDTGDTDILESSPNGTSFAAKLTADWENEALKAVQYNVRVVLLRTGFVVGPDAPALKKMVLPFKLFAGGYPGNGKQYLSWIHIHDLINLYLFVINNTNVKGAVNAAAPYPVIMKAFCKQLGKVLKHPSFLPVPGVILKLLYGQISETVLSGRKALPKKIQDLGFQFKYTDVYQALAVALNYKSLT